MLFTKFYGTEHKLYKIMLSFDYSSVGKALRYKPEGRKFETLWDKWYVTICLSLAAALGTGVYSASTGNEYQKHKSVSEEHSAGGA
jgi:hypothetical protein